MEKETNTQLPALAKFNTLTPCYSVEEAEYVQATLPRVLVRDMNIMETESFKELWSIVQNVMHGKVMRGLLILGPAGAGKTTALIYLMNKFEKLESRVPCVLMFTLSSCNKKVSFLKYLKWFCEANKVTVSDASLTADPYTLFYYILSLRGTLFKERKCFLLADMGAVSKFGDAAVSQFISTITNADLFEWFIVLAPSSGVGWKHNTTSADENFVRELMRTFRIRFHHFQLTNLTSTEALYYIRMIGAAREGEEKSAWDEHLSAATKGNPLLLRCYEGASVKGTIEGDALVVEELRVIVGRLIDTIKDEVYHNSIENCHRWLMCAEQQYPILLCEKSKYTQSYVAREYLTYVDTENKTHFYLSPAYPMLYATFASLLMEKFSNTSHAIARSAVVQGLVFEHKFLHHPGLRGDLNVTTVTKDNIIHKFTFNLSTLSPPQCNTALQQLSLSCLHHLRPGHPAIDAVCLTTNSANPADENYYLLLMQVSLSKYSDHRSKAIDIRKVVVAPEKDVAPNPNLSVAEFYRSLAKQENVKIVYIYASPQQLKEPSPKDFVDELADKNLRSGTDCPDYYYGFVDHDSMAGCMLKQLQEVTL